MVRNYDSDNDSELLYLISENNEDAKKVFIDKYDGTIRLKANKYKKYIESKGYDYNDLLQEGMLGLTRAINDYKEQKNIKFSTFANICIDRQIATFIRDISREKHKALNTSISLDTTTNTVGRPLTELLLDDKNIDPEVSFLEMEEQEELFDKISKVLTKQEKDVFDLRIQGFTYKEISSLLGITSKSVDGCIGRIKSKINSIIEHN